MNTIPPLNDNSNSPLRMPNASGVYKITCTANKKIYIGSASNLRRRRNHHWWELQHNKHANLYLQRAWNKYGEQAFIFEILEFVLPISLAAREQYWFNKLKPFGKNGFNIATEANSSLGIKRSPETIEKHRQAVLGRKQPLDAVERTRQFNLGRKLPPEHIEKIRQANIGKKHTPEQLEKMKGRKLSSASREKLRQANLGKRQSPASNEKRSQAMIGKKKSPETIERMRRSKIGNTYNRGRKHTPESCENMRRGILAKKQLQACVRLPE